jgi:hypothetical protein
VRIIFFFRPFHTINFNFNALLCFALLQCRVRLIAAVREIRVGPVLAAAVALGRWKPNRSSSQPSEHDGGDYYPGKNCMQF